MADFLSMDNILTGDEAASLFEEPAVETKTTPVIEQTNPEEKP
jgi:hypothetical protein